MTSPERERGGGKGGEEREREKERDLALILHTTSTIEKSRRLNYPSLSLLCPSNPCGTLHLDL